MESEEPEVKDLEEFQPPLKKVLVCFEERKREVALCHTEDYPLPLSLQ